MTPIDRIQQQLSQLPPEKQSEVLDFVSSLRQQLTRSASRYKQRPLRDHPAFGSWRGRGIDALAYERSIRSEWDGRA